MSEISIENYKNNDQVFHSIVLIKGHVTNVVLTHSEISVILPTNTEQKFILSKKGHFKVVLELELGVNTIKLCYNETQLSHELTLNYIDSSKALRKVQPVYLLCSDSVVHPNQISSDCTKLLLGCKLAQCLYAEKLFEGTGTRKTFALASSCKPFTLDVTESEAHQLSDQALWELVGRNLIESSIWDVNVKFIAFTCFTKYLGVSVEKYSYAQIKAQTLSNPALSSGGLALLGTGCLYTWPRDVSQVIECFLDKTRVDITKELDDSNYRCTYGGCFSTTIGSVCHELGHIFDLGHTSDGIMGKDIDYVGRVFVTELLTENLPDRIVGTTRPEKAQFDKKSRFTKVNRQPGQYLIKYHEQKDDDLSFFAQNNLIALAFHKWFVGGSDKNGDIFEAQSLTKNNKCRIMYDSDQKTVCGDVQLVLVELRKCADEMLVQFWSFTEEDVYQYKLPLEAETNETVLFVMDVEGNILKQIL